MQINKYLLYYNDILIKNNLNQRLLTVINVNENINKKLIINFNNKKNYFGFRNNSNNNIEALRDIFKSDYNRVIEKLKNENKTLTLINKKIANQNKN